MSACTNTILECDKIINPTDTDVFKTSSRRLKKVTTSCDQTRRRHNVWKKTLDLRKKWLFLILYYMKYLENFKCSQFKLVYRYGTLYKSVGTSIMKELTTLNNKFYRIRGEEKEYFLRFT